MAVRGFTDSTNFKRLSIVHKRGLRIINKDAFNADAEPIFAELKLLKLAQYFYCKWCLVRFPLKLIYSLLSLMITSMLFDKSYVTPGRPISIIKFHFLELVLKDLLFFIKDLMFQILRILKFANRVASVSSNLNIS